MNSWFKYSVLFRALGNAAAFYGLYESIQQLKEAKTDLDKISADVNIGEKKKSFFIFSFKKMILLLSQQKLFTHP